MPDAPTPSRWRGATSAARVPDRLGRYVVLERIGAGMMGVVYTAYDPTLERKVAIKVLHGQTEGPAAEEARQRLVREARSMARLSHPNVVPVYDAGIVDGEDGQEVFLAMELVEGKDLAAWLERRGPPASRADHLEIIEVFLQAGRGLTAAHDAQLVHRDFKPGNALVTDDGTVKVTDFGLARGPAEPATGGAPPMPSSPDLQPTLTATGDTLGTPAYMAPEQHQGEAVGPASDQFSFCVALYEALFGKAPFEGMSYAQRALSVVQGRYEEPPADSRAPAEVARILRRGLQRDPDARFEDMRGLVEALEAAVAPRSSRATLGLGLAGLAALAAAALFWTTGTGPCERAGEQMAAVWNPTVADRVRDAWAQTGLPYAMTVQPQVAQRLQSYADAWRSARRAACEATNVEHVQSRALLDRRMTCLESRKVELEAFVLEVAQPDAALVRGALAAVEGLPSLAACANLSLLTSPTEDVGGPTAHAVDTLRRALARARGQARAGRYALSLQTVQTASAAWAGRRHPAGQSELALARGELMAAMSKPRAAERALTRAFLLAQRARNQPVAVAASAELVPVVGVALARHRQGLLWADIAQATLQQHGNDLRTAAHIAGRRARVLSAQGDRKAAIRAARRALQRLENAPGASEYEIGAAKVQLGTTLVDIRDYKAADPYLTEAVAAFERSLGPEHPELVGPLTWLGRAQQGQVKMQEAQATLHRAIQLAERHLGKDHGLLGEALLRRGTLHTRSNEHAEAIADYRAALRILTPAYGPEHTLVARAWLNIGVTFHRMGKLEQATEHYEKALASREARLGRDHPDLAVILQNLGSMAVESGRPGDAVPRLSRALAIRTEHLSSKVAVADVQFWLGRALYESREDRARGLELVRAAHVTFVQEDATPQQDTTRWLKARRLL